MRVIVVKSIARSDFFLSAISILIQNRAAPTRPITPATASAFPLLLNALLALVELDDDAALPVADAEPEDTGFAPLDAADALALVTVAAAVLAELKPY